MFFRKRAWQSKFTFCNAVTQTDALSACQKAAKECQLTAQQESPGSLLLTPGFAGKAEAWKRATAKFVGGLSPALADEPSKDEKSLLQTQVRMPRGLGLSQIRVEIRPGDATSEGVIVEVTSCNMGQFQAFVTALGERIDERFAHNPAAHGCAGSLENFLAEALPADVADRKTIKKMCRKKSLHDWYAAKVTMTNFEIGADGQQFGGTQSISMDEGDEEDSEEEAEPGTRSIGLSDADSFKERTVRSKSLSNWYANDNEAVFHQHSIGSEVGKENSLPVSSDNSVHMWDAQEASHMVVIATTSR